MTTPEQDKTALEAKNCHQCGSLIPEDAPQALCPKCVLKGAARTSIHTSRSGKKTSPASLEEVASAFPDLEILDLIGVGGMGAVYRARQKSLDREVALKILSSDLSEDPAFAERFSREGRVLARLNHPNIVAIFDFGNKGPYSFLLMEYVDGVNLRQAMQAGNFTPTESLALVQDICSALIFAHEKEILHRDIKPENILIDREGKVKIADFGIAKLVGENEQDDFTLTMQGSVMGSPQYMAPEQIETPDDVDQRADIYSLGVVLYELLTGELPLGRFAEPSKKATLDQRIDKLVMRSLEKEREARFQSATELKTKVETINQTPAPIQNQNPTIPEQNNSTYITNMTITSNKYATLSSIFAGVSICAVIAGMKVLHPKSNASDLYWILLFLLIAIPALMGFIYGMKALGHIYRSADSKTGLGAALFGTCTLPQLILSTCAFSLLFLPMRKLLGSPFGRADEELSWLVLVVLCSGIPCIISIYTRTKRGPSNEARHKIWLPISSLLVGATVIFCIWINIVAFLAEQ